MDPNPDPDPLVRGMDPRIRIRIHTKMSWIRNTDCDTQKINTLFTIFILHYKAQAGYWQRVVMRAYVAVEVAGFLGHTWKN
jgi:hypothetical protein